MTRLCLALAALLWTLPALGWDRLQIPPADEAERDPGLLAYRERLLAAVVARDAAAVAALASPDIVLGFGGGAGRDAFRARLEADPGSEAAESRELRAYWDALEGALRLGGRFDGEGRFVAPAVFTADLPGDLDPFEAIWITGAGVPLLDRPSRWAGRTGTLDWDVVRWLPGASGSARYEAVELSDGRRGHVDAEYARLYLDYRAIFERGAGGWQMTVFVAGD